MAGGNDAVTGALSAGGVEAAAPVISHWLYGTKDAEKLTAEQKDTITAITRALGSGVGAAVGGSSANAMQGSLNADSAVNNNFDKQDLKDTWDRLTGGLLGVAASIGTAGEPILHPIDTWDGLKAFANSEDKLLVLQMGLILTVEERSQDYHNFTVIGDEFGRGMVVGRSVVDIASAVTMISKSPSTFMKALVQLRKVGHATINGVKITYVGGKIVRAASNYVPSLPLKPVPAITKSVTINAGSIRNVNPGYPVAGRTHNCVNCAIATDATLKGYPASALPINHTKGVSPRVLENMYGQRFGRPVSDISIIEKQMQSAGRGATGIVFGFTPGNNLGHVFNVINQNGKIRFLDGQTGKAADLNFKQYQLLRIN